MGTLANCESSVTEIHNSEKTTCDPFKFIITHPILIALAVWEFISEYKGIKKI